MDITLLMDYFALVIVGICLCIGYAIKGLDAIPNKYIPTIMLVLGTLLSIWVNAWTVTPEVVLTGMISGLASTGLYEAFAQLIGKGEKND